MTETVKLKQVQKRYPQNKPISSGFYTTEFGVLYYRSLIDKWLLPTEEEECKGWPVFLGVITRYQDIPTFIQSVEVQIPEGWQLVPKELTSEQHNEMQDIAEISSDEYGEGIDNLDDIFKTALDLAPRYGEEQ